MEGQPIPPQEGGQPSEPQYLSQDTIDDFLDEVADPNCSVARQTDIQIALRNAASKRKDDMDRQVSERAKFAGLMVEFALSDMKERRPQLLKSPGVKAFFGMLAGPRPEGRTYGQPDYNKCDPLPGTSSESHQ